MLSEQRISSLIELGFKRWTKGSIDRLYINATQLGLACTYYNSGNISSATFNGEKISNTRAYEMKSAKIYIDIQSETLCSADITLKEAALEFVGSDIDYDTVRRNGPAKLSWS